MNEAILLWVIGGCFAMQCLYLLGVFVGLVCLWGGFMPPVSEDDRRIGRFGLWIIAASIALLVILPWPSFWDCLIELARRP